ncbi:hypothetical protein M0R45_015616 [Rubus argutus]|uniref:TF-B3 domain-containing protein n=1 Tax=Rubus argutus TaxID=59490 RepID=A0AAW1XQR7_RUBAR
MQRVPDGAAAYFRSHGGRYVHLEVDHKPRVSWAVRLRMSQSGNYWLTRGWDRFVEDNELSDDGKICLFHCAGGPTLRVSLFDIYDGTVFRGEYLDVDSPYSESDGDDQIVDGEGSEHDNQIVGTDEGEHVDVATWDDPRHPNCICKIQTYSAQLETSFVRDNLDCNMRRCMNVINPQGEGLQVNVVPSNDTLKLCKGFADFRKLNGLRERSWCKFVLLGPCTLVVSPVPTPRRRRRGRQ